MTGKNTVVLVANSLQSGGAEKQLLWIGEAMVRFGWRVIIFEVVKPCNEARLSPLIERATSAGVQFARAPEIGGYIQALPRLLSVLRREVVRVVWTWGSRADFLVYIADTVVMRKGLWLASLRNANRDAIYSSRWLYRRIHRRVWRFVGNTHTNADMLAEVCPGVDARCRYMPNVLEELESVRTLELPRSAPMPWKLGMLGNIDIHRKGYDTAVRVALLLKERDLPVRISIAGRPDQADWLCDAIARHSLQRYMHYEGETERPMEFLGTCEGFLMLSRFEGMPNALLEALSLGLPAIVTKVGDLQRTGGAPAAFSLVDIDSAEQVVAEIHRLLGAWQETLAMGARGRVWCEQSFSRTICELRLQELLNELPSAT